MGSGQKRGASPPVDDLARGLVDSGVMTRQEYDAWRMTEAGSGHRPIAAALGISLTRARDVRRSAHRKLLDAVNDAKAEQ